MSSKNEKQPKQNQPKPATSETAPTTAEASEGKRPRVRWVSTNPKLDGWWVRSFKDVTDLYGPPCDPEGKPCVVGGPLRGGLTPAERAKREAEKEAEKARIAAMSDEEKLAYAKQKREAKAAKREAKKAAEREALIAQIKAEIAAGKL